jgi:hypothetical protein
MFPTKLSDQMGKGNKKRMLCSRPFFPKLSCILENVEKYTTRQATDNSKTWLMRFAG